MEIKRNNIKKELPELSDNNLNKNSNIDFKTLDTNIILNFAGERAKELRTANIDKKIDIKKSFFLK